MGFSDFGRSIIRNNERLRRNLKEKYFRRTEDSVKQKKYLPKLELKNRNSEYRYLDRCNIVKLSIVALLTVVAYLVFDNYFGRFHTRHIEDLESIGERKIDREKREAYWQLVNMGDSYLENNQYDQAQLAFSDALRIFESGKTANFGMTMTLLRKCVTNNKSCEESKGYLKKIKESGVFSNEVIDLLEEIK